MSSEKVVITVSVTGSLGERSGNPYLPITPKEIAESALDSYEEGASVAHIHVRDVVTGKPSMDFRLYEEVVQRIRNRSDMILNLTTGAGSRFIPDDQDPVGLSPVSALRSPEKRMEHILPLRPEICSLDVGSFNFPAHVMVNFVPHVERMAKQAQEAGVKPEMEVFDMGHISIANHLIEMGSVDSPPIFQLCMGVPWGIPGTPENMVTMKNALPSNAIWTGFGIGANCYQMVAQSVLLGGNVRIGFEDTFHIEKGQLAVSNRQLVEKAVAIIRILGKEVASTTEARTLLGLT
jgi:uncharacterized protein (DUF849 family)